MNSDNHTRHLIWVETGYSPSNLRTPQGFQAYVSTSFGDCCGLSVLYGLQLGTIKNLKKFSEYFVMKEGMVLWAGIEKDQADTISALEKVGWKRLSTFKSRMSRGTSLFSGGGHYPLVLYGYTRDESYDPRKDPD